MLDPWHMLNERRLVTAQCTSRAERKRSGLAEEELRESLDRAFQAYVETLENVTAFRYLGRLMPAGDED